MNVQLKREPITLPSDQELNNELRALYKEGAAKLGYKWVPNLPETLLATALQELNIQPINKEAVEAYKKEKGHSPWHRRENPLAFFKGLMTCCIWASMVLTAVSYKSIGSHYLWPFFATWILVSIVLRIWGEFRRLKDYNWMTLNLSYYHHVVPAFALKMAVDIKKKVPSAEFRVEYLQERYREHPLPDPFLWVTTKEELYCIAVWNEPKFDAKRII